MFIKCLPLSGLDYVAKQMLLKSSVSTQTKCYGLELHPTYFEFAAFNALLHMVMMIVTFIANRWIWLQTRPNDMT